VGGPRRRRKDVETGKKRYVTRTVRGDRREAEVALGRLLGEIDDGQHAASAGTVGELCEHWYSLCGALGGGA
jgi:hypothetical protein